MMVPYDTIMQKINAVAEQIAQDYVNDEELVLVGVLNGAAIFMTHLLHALWSVGLTNVRMDFVGVSSYGSSTESSRHPKLTHDLRHDIAGKQVLIVEDIIDTGHTLHFLRHFLSERSPASLKVAVLVEKPARKEVEVPVDYTAITVENKWIEGFGFDRDGFGRGCPHIFTRE